MKKKKRQKGPKLRRKDARRKRGRRASEWASQLPPGDIFVTRSSRVHVVIPTDVDRSKMADVLKRLGYLSGEDPELLERGLIEYGQALRFGQFVLERFPEAGEVFRSPPWWFLPPADDERWVDNLLSLLLEDDLFRRLRPDWQTRTALVERLSAYRVGSGNLVGAGGLEGELARLLEDMEGPEFFDHALDLVAMAAIVRVHDGLWRPSIVHLYSELEALREGAITPMPIVLALACQADMERWEEEGHEVSSHGSDVMPGTWDTGALTDGPPEELTEEQVRRVADRLDPWLSHAVHLVAQGEFPVCLTQILALRVATALLRVFETSMGNRSEGLDARSFDDVLVEAVLEEAAPEEREQLYSYCRDWLQDNPTDPRAPLVVDFVASRTDHVVSSMYWALLADSYLRSGEYWAVEDEPAFLADGWVDVDRKDEYVDYLRQRGLDEAADWVAQQDSSRLVRLFRGAEEGDTA